MVVATEAPVDALVRMESFPVLEATPEHDDEHHESGDEAIAMRSLPIVVKQTSGSKPLRRATTIDGPLLAAAQAKARVLIARRGSADSSSTDNDSGSHADLVAPTRTLVRSKSFPARAAAVDAIEHRDVRFRFSTAASAREAVREMYAHRMREFPTECDCVCDAMTLIGPTKRHVRASLDRDGLTLARTSVFRKKDKATVVTSDDLLGAALSASPTSCDVVVHYMTPGRGKRDKKLLRKYKTLTIEFATRAVAEQWHNAVQLLVKWLARVPVACTRRIKVVVNPHSGRRRGRQIFRKWRSLLELAGIECDVEETQYSGHARDIAATLDLQAKYEALVFVGGDGTVNEFMNGIFSRDEAEWRSLVATTPVSLLCAGTDNAFGLGVGTPSHASAVYCIIKRKIRPLDVLAIEAERPDGSRAREYACCGISFGIGGDIAMESEQMRWLGVYRYAYLKIKRGVVMPRQHDATLKYVLSNSVATDPTTGAQQLQTYYDMADDDAQDQHDIELCSVYDDSVGGAGKHWHGDATSIFEPASERKFAGQWQTETHAYGTVGASNVYFETKYAHPSDGNMDLIIVRRGPVGKVLDIMWRYVAGDYLDSALVDYFKVKALVIEQVQPDPINVDGEVFDGPGPFRIEVVPRLLGVLSEK